MKTANVQIVIWDMILRKGRGKVFIAKDFLDLGNRDAVDPALFHLAKAENIQQLGLSIQVPKANEG